MADNSKKISELSSCTSPVGNNKLMLTGNTSGNLVSFHITLANLFGNTAANVVISNSYNLVIQRNTTPANSTVGGYANNTFWWSNTHLYMTLANGHIRRIATETF